MIPQEKIQEIIDTTDMVALVSEYVDLEKRGKNYFGLCPFHDDKTPSFSVSQEKKIAKCMSCKEGGNPINFLRKIKNISFDEAARELAKRNNVYLEEVKEVHRDNNERYYRIMNEVNKFYVDYLLSSKSGVEALNYLRGRGMTDELIKTFKIGFAPKEGNLLYEYLTQKKYSPIDLEDLGLINNNGGKYNDVFANRITFPITDLSDNILGYSARIYYKSDDEPRYINSKETKIFEKGKQLFNLGNASKVIRKKGFVILCEGQMDVIALTKAGYGNAICSLGTALTKEQVALISRLTKNVIILYDGDHAGIEATKKAFNLFEGFKAYSLILPDGKDPDEFLKEHPKEELTALMNKGMLSKLDFLFKEAQMGKDLSNYYDATDVKNKIFDFLKLEKEMTVVDKYLTQLAELLHVSKEAIYNDYNIHITRKKGFDKPEVVQEEVIEAKDFEIMYLALCCFKKDYYNQFSKELNDISLYTNSNLVIDSAIAIGNYYDSGMTDVAKLIQYVNQESDGVATLIYQKLTDVMEWSEDTINNVIRDIISQFRKLRSDNEIAAFNKQLAANTNNLEELLKKKLEYKRKEIKKGDE